MELRRVDLPRESALLPWYEGAHLADAFAIPLPSEATHHIERLAQAVLGRPSRTFLSLLALRDLLVAPLGLRTSRRARREGDAHGPRIFIFKVLETYPRELIVGRDEEHLAFRMSVLTKGLPDGRREFVLTSVVHCHNVLGRLYLAVIHPFHIFIVRSFLRRAAAHGWPVEIDTVHRRLDPPAADSPR